MKLQVLSLILAAALISSTPAISIGDEYQKDTEPKVYFFEEETTAPAESSNPGGEIDTDILEKVQDPDKVYIIKEKKLNDSETSAPGGRIDTDTSEKAKNPDKAYTIEERDLDESETMAPGGEVDSDVRETVQDPDKVYIIKEKDLKEKSLKEKTLEKMPSSTESSSPGGVVGTTPKTPSSTESASPGGEVVDTSPNPTFKRDPETATSPGFMKGSDLSTSPENTQKQPDTSSPGYVTEPDTSSPGGYIENQDTTSPSYRENLDTTSPGYIENRDTTSPGYIENRDTTSPGYVKEPDNSSPGGNVSDKGNDKPMNYVVFKGGIYNPSESFDLANIADVSTGGNGAAVHFNNRAGFAGEIAYGRYILPVLAIELGAGYFQSRGVAVNQTGRTMLRVVPVVATGKFFIPLGVFEPYALGGIGAYISDLDLRGSTNNFEGTTEITYGLHAGAGFNINFTDHVFAGLEGKYLWAEPSFGGRHIRLDGFITTLDVGLKF